MPAFSQEFAPKCVKMQGRCVKTNYRGEKGNDVRGKRGGGEIGRMHSYQMKQIKEKTEKELKEKRRSEENNQP